ncbi:MAG: hypothetical protein QXL14_03095 [Candidatus Aenigmatarchaeota archaeon]
MRNVVEDTIAILVVGLLLVASIYSITVAPPYLTSIEKLVLFFIPLIFVVFIYFLIKY